VTAISVCNLGKKFKLFGSPGKRLLEYLSMGKISGHTDFWALQDITFDIPAGTTLGILGQNGSGKSTLLSILAGVLEPSAGSFGINGKVSAILELGSGFHPEFSGRDNVFMYGSIMGLSKQEIDERFDSIVRFSELGDFIDQPLRTYSTGMTVRLAFSVAVNVNADILIVDEALAVGDAIFQHRCFRKIHEMQEAGKTILYVGHDTEAVRNLCNQALLLDGGRIIERGDPNTVVNKYYALIAEREQKYSENIAHEKGENSDEPVITDHNFVELLKTAKITKQTSDTIRTVQIGTRSLPKTVIYALPYAEFDFEINLNSDSILIFAIGIFPQSITMMKTGVHFEIQIKIKDNYETIFSKELEPHIHSEDKDWHNFQIDLTRYSGKRVFIKFLTKKIHEDIDSWCGCGWGWPKIVHPTNKKYFPGPSAADTVMTDENKEERSSVPPVSDQSDWNPTEYGNKKAEILNFEMLDQNNTTKIIFNTNDSATIKIKIRINERCGEGLTVGCVLRNRFTTIYGTCPLWQNIEMTDLEIGQTVVIEMFLKLSLGEGIYSLSPAIAIVHSDNNVEQLDRREDCLIFTVINNKKMEGICDLDAKFTISYH